MNRPRKRFSQLPVNDKALKRFIFGAAGSFLVKIGGGAASFSLHILLARTMGVDSYGVYVFALSWLQIVSLVGMLGLDNVLLRFASVYVSKKSWGELRGLVQQTTRWVTAAAVGLCLLVSSLLLILGDRVNPKVAVTIAIGLVGVPFVNIGALQQMLLRAFDRPVLAILPEHVVRPACMAVCVGAYCFFGSESLSAARAMIFFNLVALLAFGILIFVRFHCQPAGINDAIPLVKGKVEWFYTALPMLFISSMYLLNSRVDVLMLGTLLSSTEAGIYNAASRVATLLVFGLQSVNILTAPDIAKYYANQDVTRLQQSVRFAVVGSAAMTVPVAILLLYFPDVILSVFGVNFIKASGALRYLTIGQMIGALCGPVAYLMVMTGHQVQTAKIMAVTVLANVGLNLWLIPKMGVSGAGVSTSLTIILWNCIMAGWVIKKIKINPTISSLIPFMNK